MRFRLWLFRIWLFILVFSLPCLRGRNGLFSSFSGFLVLSEGCWSLCGRASWFVKCRVPPRDSAAAFPRLCPDSRAAPQASTHDNTSFSCEHEPQPQTQSAYHRKPPRNTAHRVKSILIMQASLLYRTRNGKR